MKKYIGVKMVEAEPMMKRVNTERSKNDATERFEDVEGYKVVYPDGYVSWSPKEVFEEAYRECDCMTFGLAVEAAKKGLKIARQGWNGRGMFVVYQKGYPQGIPCNKQTAEAWGMNEGDLFICKSYLQIKNVDGSHSMWVPSIGDVLGEDWTIVE